ncbi:glycoside hydrolase superfamily, partial [Thamnocephalis sphaerospora]
MCRLWLLLASTLLLSTAAHGASVKRAADNTAVAGASTAADNCSVDTGLVLYWGQNSYGAANPQDKPNWEGRLAQYCRSGLVGTVVLSFMHIFGRGRSQMNFANHCDPDILFPNTQLMNCPELQEDVVICQNLGVKVELGLGGAAGSYGLSDDASAVAFAEELWGLAFGGTNAARPFGNSSLDGVNLDIEGGSSTGYARFVNRLRELHSASTASKRPLIVTAAPQCPYPDAYMHDVIMNAQIDAVYVQFYNNYCGVQAFGTSNFNFDIWDLWSRTYAKRPGAKIYLGIPASATAAGSGYVSATRLREIINGVSRYPSFGGVMMWDSSQAFAN